MYNVHNIWTLLILYYEYILMNNIEYIISSLWEKKIKTYLIVL